MYLNGELAKKTDEILDLQEQVATLQDTNERQVQEAEQRLMVQKDAAEMQAAEHLEKIMTLENDLRKVR